MIFVKSLAVPLKFKIVVSSFGFPDTAFHLKSAPFAMYEGHPSTWSERRRAPKKKNPAVKPAAQLKAAAEKDEKEKPEEEKEKKKKESRQEQADKAEEDEDEKEKDAPNEAMAAAAAAAAYADLLATSWPPAAAAQEDSTAYAAATKQTSVDDVEEINNNKLHHLLHEILDREKQNEELLKELRDKMGDVFARVNITAYKLDDLKVLVNDMNHQVNDMNHWVNKMKKLMVQAGAPEVVECSTVSDQDSDK